MSISPAIFKIINKLKNHGGYFITTFLNNSIPLLFLPILTRYLEPEEYANIALFNFYLAISNSLSGVSIPSVISKTFFDKPKEYTASVIGNSIRIVFTFSLITTLFILAFYNNIETWLDLPLPILLLIPWGSFFYVIISIALSVIRNKKQVLLFSYHKIGNTLINFLISLILVVILLWGWQGRVTGVLISYVISAIFALIYLIKNKYLNFNFSKEISKNILNIVLPLMSNSFQTVIISRVGLFFIQVYFTKEILGIYSVG